MIDFSIFTTAEAWISLITLIFLEFVLGVDNIVFISITTDRLPEDKQHIGRRLGLLGAMLMRIIFLSFASWLVHMVDPLFTIDLGFYSHGFSIRDMVLFLGGMYLVYKSIIELRSVITLEEEKSVGDEEALARRTMALPQAISLIMVMDLVFSIDSVITAVGLAEHLIIMIIAVMSAIIMMMLFIDQISNFINKHIEMKILALVFIGAIGILLTLDGLGITTGQELLGMHFEKVMVYFAMLLCLIVQFVQLAYKKNKETWEAENQSSID